MLWACPPVTLPYMPRRVASASFVISAVKPNDFPVDGRPEIALVTRWCMCWNVTGSD